MSSDAATNDLRKLRKEYPESALDRGQLKVDPFEQFEEWFTEYRATEPLEPNAMVVATATPDGRPSARAVLLKEFSKNGFVFYTNYESRKGAELAQNPRAALLFYWEHPTRQVRIEGNVERVSRSVSQEYFQQRPRGSQVAAAASPQSAVVSGREWLEERFAEVDRQSPDADLECPEHWGGYLVIPELFEFWQGGRHRLHDRFCYTRLESGEWKIDRLAP